MEPKGWFVDVASEEEGYTKEFPWIACLEVSFGCVTLSSSLRATKAECEQFIRDEVIGKELNP